MAKNIIICCDGTGNEFGDRNSNVIKLYKMLVCDQGQVAYYHPDLNIVRHAMSIDERRAFFRQNLFGLPNNPKQDIFEVWFAGVHSDVGGSYPEPQSQLSKLALRWMVCEAEIAGLKINPQRKDDILGGKQPYVPPDPVTKNQHNSLTPAWWIAEIWPKIASRKNLAGEWKKYLRVNLARRRWIAPGSRVHESVEQRLASPDLKYKPSNLPEVRSPIQDRYAN